MIITRWSPRCACSPSSARARTCTRALLLQRCCCCQSESHPSLAAHTPARRLASLCFVVCFHLHGHIRGTRRSRCAERKISKWPEHHYRHACRLHEQHRWGYICIFMCVCVYLFTAYIWLYCARRISCSFSRNHNAGMTGMMYLHMLSLMMTCIIDMFMLVHCELCWGAGADAAVTRRASPWLMDQHIHDVSWFQDKPEELLCICPVTAVNRCLWLTFTYTEYVR